MYLVIQIIESLAIVSKIWTEEMVSTAPSIPTQLFAMFEFLENLGSS